MTFYFERFFAWTDSNEVAWRLLTARLYLYEPFGSLLEWVRALRVMLAGFNAQNWAAQGVLIPSSNPADFLTFMASHPPAIAFPTDIDTDPIGMLNERNLGALEPVLGIFTTGFLAFFNVLDYMKLLGVMRLGFDLTVIMGFGTWLVKRVRRLLEE